MTDTASRSKIHSDPDRLAAIAKMSPHHKNAANAVISARNAERTLRREEPLTITDDEPTPLLEGDNVPMDDKDSVLKKAAEDLLQWVLNPAKRPSSPIGDSYTEKTKRPKLSSGPESEHQLGELLSDEIHLLDYFGTYIPLTLFTRSCATLCQTSLNSLKTTNISFVDAEGEFAEIAVIDPDNDLLQKEERLDYPDWSGAYQRMVNWSKTARSDLILYHWLTKHFSWLSQQITSGAAPFEAILKLDIKFRIEYHMRPFKWDCHLYASELSKMKMKLLEESILAHFASISKSLGSSQSRSIANFNNPRSHSSHGPTAGSRRSTKRPANCLICAGRGHHARACTATTFADGSQPLFCRWDTPSSSIVTRRSGNPLCAYWNASGHFGKNCEAHPTARHTYACSFCGESDHNAFSFECKPRPN